MNSSLKFSNLLFLFSAIMFLSCNDDEAVKNNRKNILGTWEAFAVSRTGCSDGALNGADTVSCTSQDCIRYIFETDSTDAKLFVFQTIIDGRQTARTGTYSVGEEALTVCEDNEGEEICETFRIDLDETTLMVTSTEEDSGCRVVTTFQRASEED